MSKNGVFVGLLFTAAEPVSAWYFVNEVPPVFTKMTKRSNATGKQTNEPV